MENQKIRPLITDKKIKKKYSLILKIKTEDLYEDIKNNKVVLL